MDCCKSMPRRRQKTIGGPLSNFRIRFARTSELTMRKNSSRPNPQELQRRWRKLAVIAGVISSVWPLPAVAQLPSVSVRSDRHVESSSDLAAALNPAQWTAVEQAIDRGLVWMAAQQRADGSFA